MKTTAKTLLNVADSSLKWVFLFGKWFLLNWTIINFTTPIPKMNTIRLIANVDTIFKSSFYCKNDLLYIVSLVILEVTQLKFLQSVTQKHDLHLHELRNTISDSIAILFVNTYIRETFLGYLTLDQMKTTANTLLSVCRQLIEMSFPLRGVILAEYDPYKFHNSDSEDEYNPPHRKCWHNFQIGLVLRKPLSGINELLLLFIYTTA